jgi:uncharacterized damage-inducible protein DinB
MNEIGRIADQLRRAQRGGAWHGPALAEALEGMTAAQAAARPLPAAHSAGEIVRHLAVWEDVARRCLAGEDLRRELSPEEDWPPVRDSGEAAWRDARRRLDEGHERLLEAVRGFPEERLDEKSPRGVSFYVMLHGIVQHDLYHAGQIALLRKGGGR